METIKSILADKKSIYFIRLIGWVTFITVIHITFFNREFLDKYPLSNIIFILLLFFIHYKVDYKDMRLSKRIAMILLILIFLIVFIYADYTINFKV